MSLVGGSQTVAVLGASSGLGAALAVVHARRGDNMIVVARREKRLAQLRRELIPRVPDDHWTSIRADLCDPDDGQALADCLASRRVDRMYLCAGANQPQPSGGVAERLRVIEPYFRLIFGTYVALTGHLIDRAALGPSSRVVVISSLAAVLPFPQLELYSAGKAALEGWCRGARDRGGPAFTVVRPGLFKSEFFHPSETLKVVDLPLPRAARIVSLVDQHRDFVDVGGWRDVSASRLSSLLGPSARCIIAKSDIDSSVLDSLSDSPTDGK